MSVNQSYNAFPIDSSQLLCLSSLLLPYLFSVKRFLYGNIRKKSGLGKEKKKCCFGEKEVLDFCHLCFNFPSY